MTSDAGARTGSHNPRPPAAPGIFSAGYLWATIGSCALVFLSAFESLAVTTIMPLVSADLDGAALYAFAFAGPLATGVIGMVVAGNWSDRIGPIAPLLTSVALFIVGLIIAGLAPDMTVFLLGRLVQGLGSGAMNVALYVVVARIYPAALHARIFAGFAAAWVVPSLVGPFAAGVVAELTSWHWVFLGVVVLVLIAMLMVVPALRMLRGGEQPDLAARPAWAIGKIGWAVLAAAAVLGLNLSARLDGALVGVVAVAAVVIALVAVRPLLPTGTLRAERGLPSVILLRGLISAAFFGTEVYIPYLLTDRYDYSAALSGLALTGAALTWAGASWIQGRLDSTLSSVNAMRIGTVLVLLAILSAVATAAFELSPLVVIGGWLLGGGGMGLMYPRLSVMTLSYSTDRNQGFNSSALSISDSLGGALALASTGIVFAALVGLGGAWPFAGCFLLAAAISAATLGLGSRVGTGVRAVAASDGPHGS
ncbi:MFS transporter [Mycetocola zhujimingii]|uniref:MFS transporter n=1 Tax=Mycetocola zhujimingii TaxID=2079792 RepID=UPI000D340C46|nr:MFS transporter [Mycetocola zhujimingii]